MKIKHHVKIVALSPCNGFVEVGEAIIMVMVGTIIRLKPMIPERDSHKIESMSLCKLKIALGDPLIVKSVPEPRIAALSKALGEELYHVPGSEHRRLLFIESHVSLIVPCGHHGFQLGMHLVNIFQMGVGHWGKPTLIILIRHEFANRLQRTHVCVKQSGFLRQAGQMVVPLHLEAGDPGLHHQPSSKIHAPHGHDLAVGGHNVPAIDPEWLNRIESMESKGLREQPKGEDRSWIGYPKDRTIRFTLH